MVLTVVLFLKNPNKKLFKDFLINGRKSEGLNPFDRGLAFGDGVFRTFKVCDQNPLFWKYHYNLLRSDANKIGIKVPSSKILLNQIKKLFTDKGVFVGKFILTRGFSDRGYNIPSGLNKPNCILLKSKLNIIDKKILSNGVHIDLCKIHPSANLKIGSIKHLNRLENVLAKKNITKKAFDGLMINEKKYAVECTSHNIFLRFKNSIIMPKFENTGISGVSQILIADYAKKNNYLVRFSNITLEKLNQADEFFIANSVNGVIPVRSFNEKKWKDFKFVQEFIQSVKF